MGSALAKNFSLDANKIDFHIYEPCRMENGEGCPPCREIQDVERQIYEASGVAVEKLIKRRQYLKSAINEMHDPISRQLPPEIASTVFQFYIHDGSDPLWNEHEESPNPFVLGAVCRAWREIAWSTPRLWATLSLLFYLPVSGTKMATLVQLAQQWLDRAGQLPLTITFRTESGSPIEIRAMHAVLYCMIDLIKQYYSRWHRLSLDVDGILLPHFFLHLRGKCMIQMLQIGDASIHSTFDESLFDDIDFIPSKIIMTNIRLRRMTFFWDNVTYVELCDIPLDDCLEVLCRALKLKKYRISDILQPGDHFPLPMSPIVHTNLEDLKIIHTISPPYFLNWFFANIKLPCLASLSCQLLTGDCSLSSAVFESFFDRSLCRLSNFRMATRFEDDDSVSILRKTPYLKNLDLSIHGQSSSTLNPLFQLLGRTALIAYKDSKREVFLPSLQSLKIWVQTSDLKEFGWGLVPHIFGPLSDIGVKERRPLQDLTISLRWPLNPPPEERSLSEFGSVILSQFLELRNAGISLQLSALKEDLLLPSKTGGADMREVQVLNS
ncbi:hypothetical protein CPB84DRAFT_1768703 [Gymnopilus junonius]|uniref:F-box domain-containing protein n=1 Tax=Gymnopilus junonius TaxID=109634 RepID=A0A9P5TQR7_GYMJU|nr:hypothetical protein CPB84DRAFT_1768703 [Gymnopilus junonius]